jgi:hypothetical protein
MAVNKLERASTLRSIHWKPSLIYSLMRIILKNGFYNALNLFLIMVIPSHGSLPWDCPLSNPIDQLELTLMSFILHLKNLNLQWIPNMYFSLIAVTNKQK